MKKIALAVLCALCGARIYGMNTPTISVEDVEVSQAIIEETLATIKKNPQQLEALSKQLDLPQKEVKSWFSRHKIATTVLAAYLVCGGLATWARYIGKNKYDKHQSFFQNKGSSISSFTVYRSSKNASSFRKFCGDNLIFSLQPFYFAQNHKVATAALVLAIIIAYEIYQGKDSAAAAVCNKLFGKKEVVAPVATKVIAEPAQPAEEVAPATPATAVAIAPVA